jgi:hypothetical protein
MISDGRTLTTKASVLAMSSGGRRARRPPPRDPAPLHPARLPFPMPMPHRRSPAAREPSNHPTARGRDRRLISTPPTRSRNPSSGPSRPTRSSPAWPASALEPSSKPMVEAISDSGQGACRLANSVSPGTYETGWVAFGRHQHLRRLHRVILASPPALAPLGATRRPAREVPRCRPSAPLRLGARLGLTQLHGVAPQPSRYELKRSDWRSKSGIDPDERRG